MHLAASFSPAWSSIMPMAAMVAMGEQFRDNAPTSAAQAATIILDAVLEGQWRILVGEDAHRLDDLVREDPWGAYEPEYMDKILERGIFEAFPGRS